MLTKPPAAPALLPQSLQGYDIPEERLALIRPHMAALAATALAVSDDLPLQADGGDFAATLDAEQE